MSRYIDQNCRLIGAHLTTTANTTLFTASGYVQAIGVRLANLTGADVAGTVSYFSILDNDEYRVLFQHLVPANGAIWIPLEAFGMNEGDAIRVQAASADALDAILSITEIPGRSG